MRGLPCESNHKVVKPWQHKLTRPPPRQIPRVSLIRSLCRFGWSGGRGGGLQLEHDLYNGVGMHVASCKEQFGFKCRLRLQKRECSFLSLGKGMPRADFTGEAKFSRFPGDFLALSFGRTSSCVGTWKFMTVHFRLQFKSGRESVYGNYFYLKTKLHSAFLNILNHVHD